jgi:N-acetylmuramoyl-L-alanine amidase
LCLSLLLTAPLCQAGKKNKPPAKDTKTAVQTSEKATTTPVVEKITQMRWTVQRKPELNDSWLRLVLDVTGPVKADGTVVSTPAPHLVVNVKGTIPVGIDSAMSLDGIFANAVNISTEGPNSKLMIALPTGIDASNCRIFTLPPDTDTNKPNRLIIDISNPAPPPEFCFSPGLKGKVIVLDPGHGGSDTGAIGPGGTTEKVITLSVARKVEALLEKEGARVVLTRRDDYDVFGPDASGRDELNARVAIAEYNDADLFLSIHADAAANPLANGTSTFYSKKSSYDALLAYNLQQAMIQAEGLRDRSFFPANFYVVKYSSMPAALVELAFVSNAKEEKLLNDPQVQQKMAQGIVSGLDHFFVQASKK